MNLVDAVKAFEAGFTIGQGSSFIEEDGHDIVGNPFKGRVVTERAPTGGKYVVIASGGRTVDGKWPRALFADEEDAAEEWLRHAWSYAEKQGGKVLYWAERPEWSEKEFICVDQADALNDHRWRNAVTIKMGRVYSKMFITKADADTPAPVKKKVTI